MRRIAEELGAEWVALLKVPAHEDKRIFDNELEQWLADGNAAADTAAKWANQARDPTAWKLWEAHVQQRYDNCLIATVVRQHMLAVSPLWSNSARRDIMPAVSRASRPTRETPQLKWSSETPIALHLPSFSRFFGPELASEVGQWISRIRDPAAPLRWISFILYDSFWWSVGPISIAKRDGKWVVDVERQQDWRTIPRRTKWFRLMLQEFLRDAQVDFITCTTGPFSQWICCRGAIGFQIDQGEYTLIESFLQNSGAGDAARVLAGGLRS